MLPKRYSCEQLEDCKRLVCFFLGNSNRLSDSLRICFLNSLFERNFKLFAHLNVDCLPTCPICNRANAFKQ